MMKRLFLFAAAATLSLGGAASADDRLPLQLLAKPMHLGDQTQKTMKHPEPDAPAFETSFTWNARPPLDDLFLIVRVSHMIPKDYPEFIKGFWHAKLILNDQEAAILNKYLHGKQESPKVETVVVPIKGSLIKTGENTLKIQPGAKDSDLDDLELESVILDSRKPG